MKFKVVITNASKHHSYETALAAQEFGSLNNFIVSIYYKPQKNLYRLIKPFKRVTKKLMDRCHPNLNPELVKSIPFPEILSQILVKLPFGKKSRGQIASIRLKYELFDYLVSKSFITDCDILHSFDGCALLSFQKAKELGSITILDQPTPHISFWQRIITEEEELTGLSIPLKKNLHNSVIERKYKELALTDYVFVPSQLTKRTLLENGIPSNKIHVIPYGANYQAFTPNNFCKNNKRFTLLFVGRIELLKGVHYLLEAYRQLNLPNAEIVLIGQPSLDGIEILKKYAGLYRHIPYVPHYNITQYYQKADVFILPSLIEGSSYTIYEAMSCGLPTIITENCGAIARNKTDGYVIPIRDIDALKEKILLLYEEQLLRREMGKNAREYIKNFTWGTYHSNVVKAYSNIINRHKTGLHGL